MLKTKLQDHPFELFREKSLATDHIRLAVISDAVPERNGVGAYYQDLLDHLRPRLAATELVSPPTNLVKGERRYLLSLPGDATQPLCFPPLLQLRRILKRLQPHVIIVPTPGPYGLAGMLFGRQLGAVLIAGFHTHFEQLSDLYWSRWFGGASKCYLSWANRRLFKASHLVLANSQEMVETAYRLGAGQAELIGTPVPQSFVTAPVRPLSEKGRKALFAGRLAPEKNLASVLEAARLQPDWQFTVAGDGPLRPLVERTTRDLDNLTYRGWLDRDALRAEFDRADLLLLPSKVESFGTVALEAMIRGRMVLVSAGCGIQEWTSMQPGLLVMSAGQSLDEALQGFASLSPMERQKRADAGRLAACAWNDWTIMGWLELLNRSVV